jgi:hypothetical protein
MKSDHLVNFQAISKISGNAYQDTVKVDLWSRGYLDIYPDVEIGNTGCEVDFVAVGPDSSELLVECKGGYNGPKKRPGAKRTDNVKKSIANAALIKAEQPDCYYVVYFSARPKTGSYSAKMIDVALKHKIVDEVRYVSYNGGVI